MSRRGKKEKKRSVGAEGRGEKQNRGRTETAGVSPKNAHDPLRFEHYPESQLKSILVSLFGRDYPAFRIKKYCWESGLRNV
ncbi:hypothetical protein HNY73_018163 [Argiope bruennichi]|uniref:Uncharacterized protein n=1 Tax=Argiope bruennichi TaxID=94029 RepID=A0A8T0EDD1_ARGBR|nr:hypothetical protein HNY73_018163 [Argiope bruennichi]